MTINQTPITDQLEDYLISIGPTDNDHIGFVFSSAFAFDEPYMQVSKLQALTLKHYIMAHGIRSVLEVGTFVGFSAFSMASGMNSRGSKLTSIEIRKDFYDQALANQLKYREDLARGDLRDGIIEKIDFVHDDALTHLTENTNTYSKYDMFFLDGDKEHYAEYVRWFVEEAKPGAHLLIDNLLFKGAILGEGKYAKGIKAAIQVIRDAECLTSYIVPVGDCMLVARKLETA